MHRVKAVVSVATFVALVLAARSSQGDLLWFWFSECAGRTITLEVRLDKGIVHQWSIPLCHAASDSAHSQGQKRRIHFVFRPHRSIVWTGYRDQDDHTRAGQLLEGDLWEAGADPDALLIGVSFSDGHTIYMNVIHIAHPTKRDETKIAEGLVVITYPAPSTSHGKR